MSMKPIEGDGSKPIAKRYIPNTVNAANEHPSGEWGAICKNTVTQPKNMGNKNKPLPTVVNNPKGD